MGGAVESGFGGGVLLIGNLVTAVVCGSLASKLEPAIAVGVCVEACVRLGRGAVVLFADDMWEVGRAERHSSTKQDEVKGCDCDCGGELCVAIAIAIVVAIVVVVVGYMFSVLCLLMIQVAILLQPVLDLFLTL